MATIASLIINAKVDPNGVKAGLDEALRNIQRFKGLAKRKINLQLAVPNLQDILDAQKAVGKLTNAFIDDTARAREGLARGLIDEAEFKRSGIAAAKDFNDGLLRTIDSFAKQGKLTPQIRNALSSAVKPIGVNAAEKINFSQASTILKNLQQTFRDTIAKGREDLERGVIDPKKFRKIGTDAAKDFNAGLLAEIQNLRGQGLLTPDLYRNLTEKFKSTGRLAGQSFVNAAHPLLGNLTTTGQRAANTLLNGLNQTYKSRISDLKEQLANGLITVQQFRRRGLEAAKEFDRGISDGLTALRQKGQATEAITDALVSSYKLAGLKAANQFAFSLDKQLGENITSFGRNISLFVSAPIAGAIAASAKLGASFESSLLQVKGIMQPTREQMEALTEQARQLGASTQFSAREAAEAQAFLAQQSFTTTEILRAMPAVLNLAAAKMIDMSTAADISSKILRGFALPVEALPDVIDKLVLVSNKARTNIQELGTAFSYVAPDAASAGQSFTTVAAALGVLSSRGIPASRAGTALRGIFSSLVQNASGSTKAAIALQNLGIKVYDAEGNFRSFLDILQQFEVAQKKFSRQSFNQALTTIFDDRQLTGFYALLRVGSKALGDFDKQLQAAEGTGKRIATTQMSGLTGAFKEVESAVEELAAAINESGLLKSLTDLTRVVADFVRGLAVINPKLLDAAVKFGAVLAVVGPLIYTLGKMITVIAVVRAIFAGLGLSMTALASGLLPGGALLLGLGLLAAVILQVATNAGRAKAKLDEFKGTLNTLGEDQLRTMEADLIEKIKRNQSILRTLQKLDRESVKENIRNTLLGPNSELSKTTRTIMLYQEQLKAVQDALRKIGTAASSINGPDLSTENFAPGTQTIGEATSALEVMLDRVKLLIGAAGALDGKLSELPGLVEALDVAWAQVDAAIKKNGNTINDQLVELLNARRQLNKIAEEAGFRFPRLSIEEVEKALLLNKPKQLIIQTIVDPAAREKALKQLEQLYTDFKTAQDAVFAARSNLSVAQALSDPALIAAVSVQYDRALQKLAAVKRQLLIDVVPIVKSPNVSRVRNIVDEMMARFQRAADNAAGAKLTLDFAEMSGNRERIAAATLRYQDALAAAQLSEKSLAQAVLESNLPLEAKKELLEKINKLIAEYKREAKDGGDKLQKFFSEFDSAANAVRGLARIAQALGTVNDEAIEALNSVSDIISALADFQRAQAAGSMFGQIGAAISAIGGVVSLMSSLFGESAAEREFNNIQRKNNEELAALRLELRNFRATQIGDALKIQERLPAIATAIKSYATTATRALISRLPVTFDAIAKKFGTSFDEILALAKAYNINILDKDGNILISQLKKLEEAIALNIEKLTKWGQTLDAQSELINLRRNVFNLSQDGVAQIGDQLLLLQKFAPMLADLFKGLDPATEEGRRQIEKALQQLFDMAAQGLLTPEMFGTLNGIDDLKRIIEAIANGLDSLRANIDSELNRLQIRRKVFNLDQTGAGAIEDQLFLLTKFAPKLAEMFAGLDASTAEGRQKIQEALQALFTMLEEGILTSEDFGSLNGREDLLKIISAIADALGTFKDSIDAVNGSLTNVPQGFKVERVRFQATMAEMATAVDNATKRLPRAPLGDGTTPGPYVPGPITQDNSTTVTFSGDIIIQGADKDGAMLYDEIRSEAIRRGRARFGRTTNLDTVLP